jgi:nitrate/nitrite transporter NarK
MNVTGKRVRGWFIRLVLNRAASIGLGLILLVPALWLRFADYRWETPISDALGLIVGATGAAILFAGIGGRRPDWIDSDN